jgi:hypothetical protein
MATWKACYTSLMTSLNKPQPGAAKQIAGTGTKNVFDYINKRLSENGKPNH